MAKQFLDITGLQTVLKKLKNVFVPQNRKIAGQSLNKDVTAEALAADLKPYVKGEDGKSAYEVAVNEGFVGSERRWLESLKGIDASHSWDGTTLTITSASGTSSADLKGEQGERGPIGPQGEHVFSESVAVDDGKGNVFITWINYEDGNEVEY